MWRVFYPIGSGLLTVIGLAGLQDDLAAWATWLQPLQSLDPMLVRWTLALIGAFGLAHATGLIRKALDGGPARQATTAPGGTSENATGPLIAPHDQVCWEYNEHASAYDPSPVLGPLCPVDYATLLYEPDFPGGFRTPIGSDGVTVGPEKGVLFCPACRQGFLLDPARNKSTEESRLEARAVLEGVRRQRRSGRA